METYYAWTLADGTAISVEPGSGTVEVAVTGPAGKQQVTLPVAAGEELGAALFKAVGTARQNLAKASATRSEPGRSIWND